MRPRWLRQVLALALIAAPALGAPTAALAQASPGNPLSPGLPQGQPTTQTNPAVPALPTTSTTSTAGDGGLSGSSTLIIAIGALVILGGISLFIWRDARRRAPVRARPGGGAVPDGKPGSKQRAKPRKLSPAERRRRKRGRARR